MRLDRTQLTSLGIKMCRAPCRRRWRSTRCMMRVSASAVFAALFAFSAFDPLGSYPAALRGYTWTYFGDAVSPDSLEACFSHVSGDAALNGTARGDAAAVVALASLLDLARREGLPLRTTASLALSSALEGGAYHVVLVPGGPSALWTDDALEAVRDAVAGVVDHHGDALPTRFSRVSPSAVRVRAPLALTEVALVACYVMLCFLRSAWESATSGPGWSGASRRAPRPSCTSRRYLCRRACRCGSERPRRASSRRCGWLHLGANGSTHSTPPVSAPCCAAQINTSSLSGGSVLPPLRKHFQSCGGELARAGKCDPLPDALHVRTCSDAPMARRQLLRTPSPLAPSSSQLCSTWLRPVVQYGLCHPASDASPGRHTTAAANSPGDPTLFSGHRLLEEVAPVILPLGSVTSLAGLVTDASFADPGTPLAYNRLADRAVGWMLVDAATGGAGAQAAVELVLGSVLRANITLLAPGRMCHTATGDEGRPAAPSSATHAAAGAGAREPRAALEDGIASARKALTSVAAPVSGAPIPFSAVVGAVDAAAVALAAAGALPEVDLVALSRWMRVYAWALWKQVGAGLCVRALCLSMRGTREGIS